MTKEENKPRAPEERFSTLHNLVTEELITRVQKGEEATTADLKAAIEWLTKNNITGVAVSGSPLRVLLESIEEEDVERAIR